MYVLHAQTRRLNASVFAVGAAGRLKHPRSQVKAAKDKLRIVRESIDEHDAYEAAVAAHNRDLALWHTKKAALEAVEAANKTIRDMAAGMSQNISAAAAAVGASDPMAPDPDAPPPPPQGGEGEDGVREDRDPYAAIADGAAADGDAAENPWTELGPEPQPPPHRDVLREIRIAADGSRGHPLFLLACGMLEGAGTAGLGLQKTLLAKVREER